MNVALGNIHSRRAVVSILFTAVSPAPTARLAHAVDVFQFISITERTLTIFSLGTWIGVDGGKSGG